MVQPKQTVAALKTKLETGRRRAEAAEASQAKLERLNKEKEEKVKELEERLSLMRSASITLKHLVPVLQKLRDAEIKLKQRTARADEAETKYDALNTQTEELQAQYDDARKEGEELSEMLRELNI